MSICNATSKVRILHCRHYLSCGRKFLCSHHVQKLAKEFQSSSFAPRMNLMKRRSTSVKVTFDPCMLCRHSCRRCFFLSNHFFQCFSFHLCLYSSPRHDRGDAPFFGPFPSFLSDFVDFLFFPLGLPWGFSLLLSLVCDVFSLRQSPFPSPLWILYLSTPFPEPTLEAKIIGSLYDILETFFVVGLDPHVGVTLFLLNDLSYN